MSEEIWKTYPCITVKQPIGDFYVASISARDLRDMCWADIRKIERGERDVEIISGIQRPLSPRRQKDIAKYVNTVDASFPTGIILAIGSSDAVYSPQDKTIKIRIAASVAKLIDGQHRVEGLKGFRDGVFELNTTIFIDMETQDQAMLFSVINVTQTKVARSLVLDLFDYAKSRSPQKTCHDIARVADTRSDSPFQERIKILGTALDKEKEVITQAGFVYPLMEMITKDAMLDRDALKRPFGRLTIPTEGEVRSKKLVFRKMFIEDRDPEIARTVFNYFNAVKERWPEAWNPSQTGYVLGRTTGYQALMDFLPYVYFRLGLDRVLQKDECRAIFETVKLRDDELTTENFKPGGSGRSALRQILHNSTGISENEAWRGSQDKTSK